MKVFGRKTKTEADSAAQVELLIEGMHCTSCGLLIDDELKDSPESARPPPTRVAGAASSTSRKAPRSTARLSSPRWKQRLTTRPGSPSDGGRPLGHPGTSGLPPVSRPGS